MSRNVVLVSYHHYLSKRKAGFHWIADSFIKLGWNVTFITAPLSPFSRLIHDHRWEYVRTDLNVPRVLDNMVTVYTYSPYYSPLSKTGNIIVDFFSPFLIPLYHRFSPLNLRTLIGEADVIIFESTAAILLFDQFKNANPEAKFIYRVSDSLEILKVNSGVLEYEKVIIPQFNLVSVPSQALYSRFTGRNVCLQYHGIRKESFLGEHLSPEEYSHFNKNFIFVGNSFFDLLFIDIASELFPDFGFHLIGPITYNPTKQNVKIYGEIPFEKTIPYLIHADVGLQIRRMETDLATLSDSLKVLQYTWCKLPIIAPKGLNSNREHIFYYDYDDPASIRNAIEESILFDRESIDRSRINDWNELVVEMLGKVEITT